MEKKRPNIVLYTILMLFLFVFIVEGIIWGYGGQLIYFSITNLPKGDLVISEAVLAIMVLIVLLIFKNSYVFTQKTEKLSTSLYYGLFYLIGSGIFTLLYGVLYGGLFTGLTLINLILGCLLIGICEEFLCRGWLLNEFLERFGDDKKGIWYSIIVSGIIFGLMHFGNIFTINQSVITTCIQVLNATGSGILFGLIYYKTKNIWSVIILHGLWDFSLYLGEIVPVTEAYESFTTMSIISLILTIFIVLAELINITPYLKDINNKPKKGTIAYLAILSSFIYIFLLIFMTNISTEIGETYKYDTITLDHYAITQDNYDEYNIKFQAIDNYSFTLNENKQHNLVFTNNNTDASIEIECEDLTSYLVLEQNDYYVLSYIDYTDSQNYFLNYIYLPKREISNDDEYLNSIKNNIKKYLIPSESTLITISDYDNDISYVSTYNVDDGIYVLVKEDNVALLNKS